DGWHDPVEHETWPLSCRTLHVVGKRRFSNMPLLAPPLPAPEGPQTKAVRRPRQTSHSLFPPNAWGPLSSRPWVFQSERSPSQLLCLWRSASTMLGPLTSRRRRRLAFAQSFSSTLSRK